MELQDGARLSFCTRGRRQLLRLYSGSNSRMIIFRNAAAPQPWYLKHNIKQPSCLCVAAIASLTLLWTACLMPRFFFSSNIFLSCHCFNLYTYGEARSQHAVASLPWKTWAGHATRTWSEGWRIYCWRFNFGKVNTCARPARWKSLLVLSFDRY